MSKVSRIVLMAVVGLFLSSNVWAARGGSMSGFLLGLDLSYAQGESEIKTATATTKSKSTVTSYDLNLGYVSAMDLYLGVIYSTSNSEDEVSTKTDASIYGPSVGFFFGPGFSIIGSYLLGGKYGTYKDGTGFQADLGWRSELGSGFFLGAKMSYQTVEYKHETVSTTKLKLNGVQPYISLGFLF